MKKDVCFVCVGQCGGNLGSLFVQKGYDVLFINTADSDLNLIKNAKHVYKIPGVSGCNQDSEKAKSVFAQKYDEIMQKVINFCNKRIVYFISSSSGGTSGMTPLLLDAFCEYLKEEEDKVWELYDAACDRGENPESPVKRKAGLITVLPSLAESALLNANSYNYLKQVVEIVDHERNAEVSNLANLFLIDNELSKDVLILNSKFVDLFDEVLRIPEKHKSVRGNVDPADLEEALTTIGVTILGKVGKDVFSISSLVKSLKTSNIFSQMENQIGKYWVSSTVEELDSSALEKEIGIPLTHYKTFNDYTNLFVLSGLGLPKERIDLIADRAEEMSARTPQYDSAIFKRDVNVQQATSNVTAQEVAKDSVKNKLDAFRRRRR